MGATETKTWTVYHLLNAAGKRIRIGCTDDLERRLREYRYRYRHTWWNQVTKVKRTSRWTSHEKALEAELRDIQKWQPTHNDIDGRSRIPGRHHSQMTAWWRRHPGYQRTHKRRTYQRRYQAYRRALRTHNRTGDLFENT